MCGSAPGSTSHVLGSCEKAKQVWQCAGIQLIPPSDHDSFSQMALSGHQQSGPIEGSGDSDSPKRAKEVRPMTAPPPTDHTTLKWSPTPMEYVKVNVDASIRAQGVTSLGIIARSRMGEVIVASGKNIAYSLDPQVGEALGGETWPRNCRESWFGEGNYRIRL